MSKIAFTSQQLTCTAGGRCVGACTPVEYPAGSVLDASANALFVRDVIAARDLMT